MKDIEENNQIPFRENGLLWGPSGVDLVRTDFNCMYSPIGPQTLKQMGRITGEIVVWQGKRREFEKESCGHA